MLLLNHANILMSLLPPSSHDEYPNLVQTGEKAFSIVNLGFERLRMLLPGPLDEGRTKAQTLKRVLPSLYSYKTLRCQCLQSSYPESAVSHIIHPENHVQRSSNLELTRGLASSIELDEHVCSSLFSPGSHL